MRSLRELRRRRARRPAGWFGQYLIEARADDGWCACRVLDVSFDGVGLELLGPWPSVGERLHVELQVTDPAVVEHPLRAVVRHVAPGYEGGLVVGVEFLDLDDAALALIRLLISLQRA